MDWLCISAPGSPPENVRAHAVSSSTVVVQWEDPKFPNGVITVSNSENPVRSRSCRILRLFSSLMYDFFSIQGYKVYYTLNPELPINMWTLHHVDQSRLTTLTNLVTNRTYTISVLAHTVIGDGPLSEHIQVVTQQGGLYLFRVDRLGLWCGFSSFDASYTAKRSGQSDILWMGCPFR